MTGSKTTNKVCYLIDTENTFNYFQRWLQEWCHLTLERFEYNDSGIDATMFDFRFNIYVQKEIKFGKAYVARDVPNEGYEHFVELNYDDTPKNTKVMDVE